MGVSLSLRPSAFLLVRAIKDASSEVFLVAMASAGTLQELQALVFDPKYIEFKSRALGVKLYFSPEFMRKNQKPTQTRDP